MHRYKNIALTGRRQVGKSTLAAWLLTAMGLPYGGYQTVKYASLPGGDLYALRAVETGEQTPISEFRDGRIQGIPAAFAGFGRAVVLAAVSGPAPVVLLDEIGRFERGSQGFLDALTLALDSPKRVIAVLKKEDIPHIQAIKARQDTLVIDLDQTGRENARKQLEAWLAIF